MNQKIKILFDRIKKNQKDYDLLESHKIEINKTLENLNKGIHKLDNDTINLNEKLEKVNEKINEFKDYKIKLDRRLEDIRKKMSILFGNAIAA